MALSTSVHDLRALIRSCHSLLIIEKVEKERVLDCAKFDLLKIVHAREGFSGSEIEQAVVAALYRALHRKQPLTTDLLIEELTHTVPLSVTRSEDINQLRAMAQGRFVNVR